MMFVGHPQLHWVCQIALPYSNALSFLPPYATHPHIMSESFVSSFDEEVDILTHSFQSRYRSPNFIGVTEKSNWFYLCNSSKLKIQWKLISREDFFLKNLVIVLKKAQFNATQFNLGILPKMLAMLV